MLKIKLWLVLLGLLLWPGLVLAQSPISYTLPPQARLSDLELSKTSGQGIDKPKSFQGNQINRIILWDEWQLAKQSGLNGSGAGNVLILNGSR